jgi:uncharacterized protein (DUF2147 family)
MRTRIGLLALGLLPELAWAGGGGMVGDWARDDGTTRIAISQCGSALCAVNTWVKDPNGKEKVGDKLVLKVAPVSSTEFQGQAYDVRRQMTFKMTITVQDNSMKTSGCVLLGVVCKDADWRRTD